MYKFICNLQKLTMVIMSVNSATLLFWAFRYMWFGIATVPVERMYVAAGLYASCLTALAITGIIRSEINPTKRSY